MVEPAVVQKSSKLRRKLGNLPVPLPSLRQKRLFEDSLNSGRPDIIGNQKRRDSRAHLSPYSRKYKELLPMKELRLLKTNNKPIYLSSQDRVFPIVIHTIRGTSLSVKYLRDKLLSRFTVKMQSHTLYKIGGQEIFVDKVIGYYLKS